MADELPPFRAALIGSGVVFALSAYALHECITTFSDLPRDTTGIVLMWGCIVAFVLDMALYLCYEYMAHLERRNRRIRSH